MKVLTDCLAVGVGGMIGSVARYAAGLLPLRAGGGFPFITLGVNVGGALAIGLIAALASKNAGCDPRLLLFLKVGLCGGFTTFSTFSYEAVGLMQGGKPVLGILYAVLSVALCLSAVALMQWAVK